VFSGLLVCSLQVINCALRSIGLGWIALRCVGLCWVELHFVGFRWVVFGNAVLHCIALHCIC
jgi:hypothetical protein